MLRRFAEKIIDEYKGSVLTEHVGEMRTTPVKLQYEDGFTPTQPPHYLLPYHYQEQLATHLHKLKAEGIIKDVDLSEPIDCVLNIANS